MQSSGYKIYYDKKALKQLSKLDKFVAQKIQNYIGDLSRLENPKLAAKHLKGEFIGLYRFKIETYRIICNINDGFLTIIVLEVGHRKNIYD